MIRSIPQRRSHNMPAHTDVQRTVQSGAPAALDADVLELTSVLQTTLELKQQLGLFANAIGRKLATDALRYRHGAEDLDLSFGRVAGHRAGYDLVIEDQALGSVELYRTRPFTEPELFDVENLLCALIYPLRNALTYRRAVQQALRDPLTGVQNRAALASAVEREVETSRRHGTSLAMLVIDIDHFKHINDNYGHSFGDDVLRAVATTAGTTIRRCDEIFRFGGEEFVVLANYTDEQGARQLAERIRRDIEAIGTVSGRDVCVTVSIGVALMPPGIRSEQLFERADQALYRAKQAGRNRFVVAD
jgi:diguanylate cyclase (GGDEF)-like protein